MLWYVIQTYTGKEEQLVEMVRRIVPGRLYGDCFVAYYEQLRRRQQANQIHIIRAFPGYVFITCDNPEELFFCLKQVPAMTRLIADGAFYFLPLDPAEADFLENIMDGKHVMRLSYVSTDGHDHVSYISGPLEFCRSRILGYRFRKRYATIRLLLSGEEKDVRLGIILNEDVRRELSYGKVEAPVQVPKKYRVPEMRQTAGSRQASEECQTPGECQAPRECHAPDKHKGLEECQRLKNRNTPDFEQGDAVIVVDGTFAGMPAVAYEIRKNTVRVGVHMFGQDMTVEVPIEAVRKGEKPDDMVRA